MYISKGQFEDILKNKEYYYKYINTNLSVNNIFPSDK